MAGSKGLEAFDPNTGRDEDLSSGFVPMAVAKDIQITILYSKDRSDDGKES